MNSSVNEGLAPVAAALLFAAAALLGACSKPQPAPEPLRAVRTVIATASPVSAHDTYAGEVRARYESALGFRVAGKIEQRAVNIGDRVQRGALLLKLDPADLALAEASSVAAVRAQEAQFAVEKADFERFAKLAETGFISQAEFERQKTRFEAAQAQLASVRAQARVSGRQTGYAELRADADGTVAGLDAEIGQVVNAGQVVVRIARAGALEVASDVPEHVVRKLAPGQAVEIRLWSRADAVYAGTIRELAQTANPATRTYALRAAVTAPPAEMVLGMTATLRIVEANLPQLIHLPLSAYIEQGGQGGVWVFDAASSTVVFRPVALAGFERNEVLVAGGLTPGERVVTAGAALLRAGQPVRLMADAPAPASAPPAAAEGSR